jgi:hypothetical protein
VTTGAAVAAIAVAAGAGLHTFTGPDPAPRVAAVPNAAAPAPATTAVGTTTAPVTPSPESAPASADPSASGSVEASTSRAPGSITWLDTADPVDGGVSARPVTFNSNRYPRGVTLWCYSVSSSFVQWNVAGSVRFEAVAGVSDDAENTFGRIVEMIFYDQDGKQLVPQPLNVSVGHPQPVSIDLTGVVNLRMTCSGRDAKTQAVRTIAGALGDPHIVAG